MNMFMLLHSYLELAVMMICSGWRAKYWYYSERSK